MNVIPHLDFPTLEEVLTYVNKDKFPCREEAKRVLLEETVARNVIEHVGDAGCMPDETVVYIDFAKDTKGDYPDSVHKMWGTDKGYRLVEFVDKYNGVLCFRFFYSLEQKEKCN